jgi:threonine dehydrogenase-like Zn-dependent dehydrogenase
VPASVGAAALVKPRTLEFARPAIGPDDALLRIAACGICGSDYERYEGAQPQHEDYTPYPVIPGHEPLGLIEEIGARARERGADATVTAETDDVVARVREITGGGADVVVDTTRTRRSR